MKVFGGGLTGLGAAMLAMALGFDASMWEYWATLGISIGIYVCAALGLD